MNSVVDLAEPLPHLGIAPCGLVGRERLSATRDGIFQTTCEPAPIVSRSNISTVGAVPHPLPTPPTTASSSSLTSSKEHLVELRFAGDLPQAADQ